MLAKFWLQPVSLGSSTRFSPKELRKLQLLGNGDGIHWLDEDLSVAGLLIGTH
jgi:hypothetical protein